MLLGSSNDKGAHPGGALLPIGEHLSTLARTTGSRLLVPGVYEYRSPTPAVRVSRLPTHCHYIARWISGPISPVRGIASMSNWSTVATAWNINTHLVSYTLPDILNIVNAALQCEQLQSSQEFSKQTSLFLQLPVEMRQAIYEAAILDDSDSAEGVVTPGSNNLLQTCRQIKMEAEPIRYQRPQSFSSQARFFHWLDRSHVANLERVRSLSIHVTDVDLSILLDPSTTNPRGHSTAWSVYQDELGKLERALRALPNLSNLTVIPPKDNRSMLLRHFYRVFVTMIPTRCPKLQRLELHDSTGALEYAPKLNEIPELIFTEAVHDRRTAVRQENLQREFTTPPRAVKIETDDIDGWSSSTRLSPRTLRRSRVTRVVSD